MPNFTKEEVDLCRQIAEKHRKVIKIGDWIKEDVFKTPRLIAKIEDTHIVCSCLEPKNVLTAVDYQDKFWFPLWTIEDCLEFLRGRGWNDIVIEIKPYYDVVKCFAEKGEVDKGYECEVEGEGKTPLEALLKAVLAVLKEAK